jgi:hypothetical protein
MDLSRDRQILDIEGQLIFLSLLPNHRAAQFPPLYLLSSQPLQGGRAGTAWVRSEHEIYLSIPHRNKCNISRYSPAYPFILSLSKGSEQLRNDARGWTYVLLFEDEANVESLDTAGIQNARFRTQSSVKMTPKKLHLHRSYSV